MGLFRVFDFDGDLYGASMTVKLLEKVADHVPFDTVTVPVKSPFGYHLILVRQWDPNLASNQQIQQVMQNSAFAALTNRLDPCNPSLAGACEKHIYIDPRFGTWGPTTDSQGNTSFAVVPPKAPNPRTSRD